MRWLFTLVILVSLFYSCSDGSKLNHKSQISVSIAPVAFIAEQIVGQDFDINILVPPGASPETYEPTPSQMRSVANSMLYINIGLIDFEKNLSQAISQNMPDVELLPLHTGIELIAGSCDHDHGDDTHGHGIDPHIWSSPLCVKIMAKTIYDKLHYIYPDSIKYTKNYTILSQRLDSLDLIIKELFANGNTNFILYHPALTYLARDYGLNQISIENDGKEPSVEHIKKLIESAKTLKIDKILYQKQFSQRSVDALSRELDVQSVAIDPLAYDIIGSTVKISKLISQQ